MNILIIFVKYPDPGKVKTRIARELGAEKAADLYSLIAGSVIENVSGSDKYRTVFFFDPPEMENGIRKWLGREDATYEPQSGNTIGERMSDAFERVFSGGAEKAVLIGTDVPEITGETVNRAFRLLEFEDAVIGPAEDGGYYLLGLKKPEPLLFDDIEWGSDSVYKRTVERIEKLDLSYKPLDTLRDVDTAEDVGPELLKWLTGDSKLRNSN
ncbi:MAG TPA: TIGR04282 family arsenosugar biosynthesis glycosyltransferase [Thermodesulfobacteriota bacterium]|nr:TIGR04282 family arsenosugar biosynthesis glycosyltransferase [Thermodesulfobacteriota bacterium]